MEPKYSVGVLVDDSKCMDLYMMIYDDSKCMDL